MKKTLLFSILGLAGMMLPTATADTLTYGMGGDNISGLGTGMSGTHYSAAIEVPEAMAQSMAGSKITQVQIGFGSGMAKAAYIYFTYDLKGEPFYEQQVTVKVSQYNTFKIDTPYVIEGKPFYIGYRYRASNDAARPIGFDDNTHAGNDCFSHLGLWLDNQEDKAEWGTYPQYGNLCLRAIIEGDNFPEASAPIGGLYLPASTPVGKEFDYTSTFVNLSTSEINSVTYITDLGGVKKEQTVEFNPPVAPGLTGTVTLSGVTDSENLEYPVSASVAKVNGRDNVWAFLTQSTTFISSDNVFPRIVVVEEGTGNTCGYCPRGIVAMREMAENYPETFIGIAMHTYSTGDPMYCSAYVPFVNAHFSTYPNAVIDRTYVFDPSPGVIENYYQREAGMVPYAVEISAEYTDDTKTRIKAKTNTRFGQDFPGSDFALTFVQTEDNVGPYTQTNNYANGGMGQMGGFESEGSRVVMLFDDVARNIFEWRGISGSVPANVTRGSYEYDYEMPIVAPGENGHTYYNIIAMLLDRSTGRIMTAGKCKITNAATGSGIDAAADDSKAVVNAGKGFIAVAGEFDSAAVYSLDGALRATLSEEGAVSLAPGVYVVRTIAGGKAATVKTIVK